MLHVTSTRRLEVLAEPRHHSPTAHRRTVSILIYHIFHLLPSAPPHADRGRPPGSARSSEEMRRGGHHPDHGDQHEHPGPGKERQTTEQSPRLARIITVERKRQMGGDRLLCPGLLEEVESEQR